MGSFKDECNQISSQNLGHSFSNARPSVTEVIILGKKQRETQMQTSIPVGYWFPEGRVTVLYVQK